MQNEIKSIYDFWNTASCGEALYLKGNTKEAYRAHSDKRYELEPIIKAFGQFENYNAKQVLEIGVGLGAEHIEFAKAGAILSGLDLTERAVSHTKERLKLYELESDLKVANAENLPYAADSFDLVFSWGVLHHSLDTPKTISEVYRVLKKGGEAKIMIYHKFSLVGFMLWIRYALFKLKPFTSLSTIYNSYLESPGTTAYSKDEAKKLFNTFQHVDIETKLSHGDLLTSMVGQRHRGLALTCARVLWPRWIFKIFCKSYGLQMLIKATK